MPIKDDDARREYMRDYCREWRKRRTPEQLARARETMLKWRAANPDKVAAIKARDYAKRKKHILSQAKQWAKDNPRAVRDHALRRFGITADDYDRMLAAQGGGCAICGIKTVTQKGRKNFHVDHCHATGVVRGLLCHMCNVGLGAFKDEPARLRRAADYIER